MSDWKRPPAPPPGSLWRVSPTSGGAKLYEPEEVGAIAFSWRGKHIPPGTLMLVVDHPAPTNERFWIPVLTGDGYGWTDPGGFDGFSYVLVSE